MAAMTVFGLHAAESHVIYFEIKDGGSRVTASGKRAIENNIVKLMTMLSEAQAKGSKSLNFSGIPITPAAKSTILQLWKYQPLKVWTDDPDIVPTVREPLLNLSNLHSYQIRNIPVRLFPIETPGKDKYSEIAINVRADGTIEDFNITMNKSQYNELIKQARTVQDLENIKVLSHWMDQLAMAYASKNLDYLRSLFDTDAIIITGVRSSSKKPVDVANFMTKETFDYYVKNRDQYMASMKRVFNNNKEIRVEFKDQDYGYNPGVLVKNNDGESTPRYYMVWCTQEWNATNYSDKGKLFVLWDFKDPENPVIMVRAWTHPDDPKQFSYKDFTLSK